MIHPTPRSTDHTYDAIESVVNWMKSQKWPFKRTSDDEILSDVKGVISTYSICYRWHPALELMTFVGAFLYQPRKELHDQVAELVLLINERLPIGHFEHRIEDEAMYYRSSSFFPSGNISDAQAHRLLQAGLSACDEYYPMFALVRASGSAKQVFKEMNMLGDIDSPMQ